MKALGGAGGAAVRYRLGRLLVLDEQRWPVGVLGLPGPVQLGQLRQVLVDGAYRYGFPAQVVALIVGRPYQAADFAGAEVEHGGTAEARLHLRIFHFDVEGLFSHCTALYGAGGGAAVLLPLRIAPDVSLVSWRKIIIQPDARVVKGRG